MRSGLLLIAISAFLLLPVGPAHALMFGEDDTIHFLQDVSATGPQGEALYLGYMTKIQFFGAGLYVTDAGYVLGVKGDSKRYFHMPTGDLLVRLQQEGSLPDPLPPYQLGIFDYLIGYSLWITLAVVALWTLISTMRKKSKAVVETPPAS